jgi:hypothetical protein
MKLNTTAPILDQRLGYVFGHFFVAGKIGISVEDKLHIRRAM